MSSVKAWIADSLGCWSLELFLDEMRAQRSYVEQGPVFPVRVS